MNISSNTASEIRLSDFGLVAALLTSHFNILRTERDGRRMIFIFRASPELQQAVTAYWSGSLCVSALQYFETTKGLKSRIYSE